MADQAYLVKIVLMMQNKVLHGVYHHKFSFHEFQASLLVAILVFLKKFISVN